MLSDLCECCLHQLAMHVCVERSAIGPGLNVVKEVWISHIRGKGVKDATRNSLSLSDILLNESHKFLAVSGAISIVPFTTRPTVSCDMMNFLSVSPATQNVSLSGQQHPPIVALV
jgi:hypothetical protein